MINEKPSNILLPILDNVSETRYTTYISDSNHRKGTNGMKQCVRFLKQTQKVILFIVCTVLLFGLTACSDGLVKTMADALDSYVKENSIYEYSVSFSALAESDYEIIEKRLEALDFKIIDKERDGDSINYRLRTYYAETDEYFQEICTTSHFMITDETGNEILTREDVNSALYERVGVTAGISETVCKELKQYADVTFMINDQSIKGYIFTKTDENGNTVVFQTNHSDDPAEANACKRALIYCAMFLEAEPLKDVVKVNVTQSATRISSKESR